MEGLVTYVYNIPLTIIATEFPASSNARMPLTFIATAFPASSNAHIPLTFIATVFPSNSNAAHTIDLYCRGIPCQ